MASLVLLSLFSHNDKKQKILEKIGKNVCMLEPLFLWTYPYAPAQLSSLIETETLFPVLVVTNKNQLQLKEKAEGVIMLTLSVCCNSKQKQHPGESKF
jgi:hypothetical protein